MAAVDQKLDIQTEVGNFAHLTLGQQHVAGGQIPVHQLDVGQVGHPFADLPGER